jgi:hypothetical protein
MPVPLIAAAIATIGTAFAQRGLDILGSLFRGALDKGTQEVADLIKDKTGIDVNNVADGKLDDAQWAKLKEFEFEYQSRLLEYQQSMEASRLEEERLHQADRADARSMQKEALKQDDVFSKRFIYYYAIGITILTFLFVFLAAFGPKIDPTSANARIIDTVLGFLLGVSLSAIIQYFFGSSAGSSRKSEVIDQQLREAMHNTASRSQGQERGQP